jgi:diguanylate cyclase (GGDEF)-like protein
MVSWRDQPTRYDIEALQANIRRVGLVVRIRWILLAVLVIYSAIAGMLYATNIAVGDFLNLMVAPALALGFVLFYNTYYSLNYRRLGNIAVWNNLQLALDALVVTVLVYFSGGVNSWFWSMYALFIFEASFILPRSRDVWLHALFSLALLGFVEYGELLGWLPHNPIPFASSDLHMSTVFVSVRYFWQVAVLLGAAWVSTVLVGELRREIASRKTQSLVDEPTGLYTRAYFARAVSSELLRAQRDNRPLHIVLIDVDRFGTFNERFGFDAGDRLLAALSRAFSNLVGAGIGENASANVVARVGGEEFAVLLTESDGSGLAPGCDDAARLAETMRKLASDVQIEGAGVTVSVGIASRPDDGVTFAELMDAADTALASAVEAGGNRVALAAQCMASAAELDDTSDSYYVRF